MACNLKNLVNDYYDDNEDDEIGGVEKITRHPKFNQDKSYIKDNREIQKKRREKDKMRKASIKHREDNDE